MVRHTLQSSGVQIDSMNRAAGSQQVRKRRCEGAAAATKITPGLRARPFNEWCTNECDGLTGLHLPVPRNDISVWPGRLAALCLDQKSRETHRQDRERRRRAWHIFRNVKTAGCRYRGPVQYIDQFVSRIFV